MDPGAVRAGVVAKQGSTGAELQPFAVDALKAALVVGQIHYPIAVRDVGQAVCFACFYPALCVGWAVGREAKIRSV